MTTSIRQAAALFALTAALMTACTPSRTGPAPAVPAPDAPSSAEARTAAYLQAIRHDPVRTLMFVREMPKGADLHSHLSGAVYAESYIEWAAASGLCILAATGGLVPGPCDPAAGRPPAAAALLSSSLYSRVVDALSVRNWNPAAGTGHAQFFGTFGRFAPATVNTPHMLAEVSDRAAAGRVSYLELMVTLDRDASGRLAAAQGAAAAGALADAWARTADGDTAAADRAIARLRQALLDAGLRDSARTALRGLDDVEARQRELQRCGSDRASDGCSVEVRYLYQVQRARAPELVFAQVLMGFEMASLDPRVVGLNLVQPEDHYLAVRDYSLHMHMIGRLRSLYPDVSVSLHAGELAPGLVPPEHMRYHIAEAVRVARAERIGHGVAIAHEDDAHGLLQEMAERRVLVEIALSSNDVILGIRGRQHPLRLYMDYGVPVTLTTDDEAVLRSDLSLEYHRAVEEHALSYAELKAMARNSIVHAFADAATRERLLQQLEHDFREFERTWSERSP